MKNEAMNDKDIDNKAGEALDRSVDALDARVLSRLNQARHTALEQRRSGVHDWLLPATFAAIAVFAVVLVSDPLTRTVENTDVLVSNDDLELIEDIEFMTWLAEQQG